MTEQDILDIIAHDEWMMKVLRAARTLQLPDWMIGAGFVRNKVWDHLHGYVHAEVPTADIDLVYYDPNNTDEAQEKAYDQMLTNICDVNWSTKNQARMHSAYHREVPYKDTEEALSEWVETPTCVAVRLNKDDSLMLFAPHGIDDLVHLIVRPTPAFQNKKEVFWNRVSSKKWQEIWPKLKVYE